MYREKLKFIDLFCGIGGFRVAFEEACEENGVHPECVFSSDIDKYAQESYEADFGDKPIGDITQVHEKKIPDHDILLVGFPLVNGERRLRLQGIFRLQGFPDWYRIETNKTFSKKRAA